MDRLEVRQEKRYYAFDTIRALAMLIGIPFHISLSYGVFNHQNLWIVKDNNPHFLMDLLAYFVRSCRMPLFFIMAGFFTHLVFMKRPKRFLIERLKRITIPWIFFSFVFLPPIKAIWLSAEKYELFASGHYQSLWNYVYSTYWLEQVGDLIRPVFNFGHLWFLMYLTCFTLITIFFVKYIKKGLGNNLPQRFLFPIACIITSLIQIPMQEAWLATPFIWYPKPLLLLYHGTFFYFGWLLYKRRDEIETLFNIKKLPIFAFLAITLGMGRVVYQSYYGDSGPFGLLFLKIWLALGTWSLIYFFIILALKYSTYPSRLISYLVESSYFFYLIHLPIVIIGQFIFHQYPYPWWAKFILINAITFLIMVPSYNYLVRGKLLERFLRGRY